MKLRNPWIDPRITQLRPEATEAYLLAHGWKRVGPAANPALVLFEGPRAGDKTATLLLPRQVTDGASLQWMIDVVAELARQENRWAVDVLNEILQQHPALASANGPTAPMPTEPMSR